MNIEAYFKDIQDFSGFPNGDYGSLYVQLIGIFEKKILPEIKAKMVEYESDGYYNDHGIEHIKMVIDRASKIIKTFTKNESNFSLSDYELFILLISIYLHDAGHLIGKRNEHANKVHEILVRHCGRLLAVAERRTIADIAKAHGGKNDPIGNLADEHISGFEIRIQLLAAILRLADEFAEDKTRASQGLLDLEDDSNDAPNTHINKYSEVFHRFSESLDSIWIEGNEIKISFCVNKRLLNRIFEKKKNDGSIEQTFLLDEIYARTYKTFLETLYCNRFFPSKSRFNVVKIKIDLLGKYDETFKTISYELVEKGYPSTESLDSLIHEQIKDGENKLDGAYFAKLINEEKHEKESVRS